MEKIGKVKAVAKTGGIIFEDEPDKWYNPIEIKKAEVAANWKLYRGKQCKMQLLDNSTNFTSIEAVEGQAPTSTGISNSDSYWKAKFEHEKFYQAMNSANRIVETFYSMYTTPHVPTHEEMEKAFKDHKKLIAETAVELMTMQKEQEVK